MKKIMIITLLFLFFALAFANKVSADYNYDPFGDVIASAEALIAKKVIDSSNLVTPEGARANVVFGELSDVFFYADKIYISDTSNDCVYVLDREYRYLRSFGAESGAGALNTPKGLFVTEDKIYVADSGNYRVAIYDHDYNFLSEVLAPDDPTFKQSPSDTKGYDFKPLKIAVNSTGRIYVIADQIFEGIIDFNQDGSFSRYVGANTVTLSVWDAFWLRLTSEEQRLAQGYRLATTFVNMNVDSNGYIYTVSSSTENEKVIKKLNYKGIDVLIRNGYVDLSGDIITLEGNVNVPTGSSEFIDIDVNSFGSYSVLDRTRGRIFTYDFEGNLLYIGGQIGNIGGAINNQSSLFLSPQSLCYQDNKILVVDSLNKNLVVLEYTEFANLVNQATEYYFLGEYENSKSKWEEVLVLNTNYFLAYAGIAKAQLREGDYEEAMYNAKLGYDDYTYSKAYKPYRYLKLTVIFPYLIAFAFGGVIFLIGKSIYKSVQAAKEEEEND